MDARTNVGAGDRSGDGGGYGTKSDTDFGIAPRSPLPFTSQMSREASAASMPHEAWGEDEGEDEDEEGVEPARYRNGYPWGGPVSGRGEPDPARPTLSIGAGMVALVARELTGYSKRRLAEDIRTSQPSLAKIESGARMPTVRALARIAQASGLELVLGLRGPEDDPSHARGAREHRPPRLPPP